MASARKSIPSPVPSQPAHVAESEPYTCPEIIRARYLKTR